MRRRYSHHAPYSSLKIASRKPCISALDYPKLLRLQHIPRTATSEAASVDRFIYEGHMPTGRWFGAGIVIGRKGSDSIVGRPRGTSLGRVSCAFLDPQCPNCRVNLKVGFSTPTSGPSSSGERRRKRPLLARLHY